MTYDPDWAIAPKLADTLAEILSEKSYRVGHLKTFETGSGRSTEIFRTVGFNTRHVALEHLEKYAALNGVPHTPLDPATGWYRATDEQLDGPFDVILIDGPPKDAGNRRGILPYLERLVGPETVILIDDVQRSEDRFLADSIRRRLQWSIETDGGMGRRWAVLRRPCGVSSWAVGITAAPRPGPPTLPRTLESLSKAGFPAPIVFAEPNTPTEGAQGMAYVSRNPTRLGAWHNFLHALRVLVDRHPTAAALVVAQDDVMVCQGLQDYLKATLWPGPVDRVAMVSPYTAGPNRAACRGWNLRLDGFYAVGALFCVFPVEAARRLLTDLSEKFPNVPSEKRIDAKIGRWAAHRNLSIWRHTPSLGQHIGNGNSALGDPLKSSLRMAADFPGQQFVPQPFQIAKRFP